MDILDMDLGFGEHGLWNGYGFKIRRTWIMEWIWI